ncbi:MAG: DNA-3-methyladenine glycosylase [Deltaproteobacteria bacterium RIFOXYA12_FULL_61_11]|nr:MAG: DNA-3-methyladenine glycosylase [Deltaproteobacteria bacterium RIFOXYA12_FULL_61_11]
MPDLSLRRCAWVDLRKQDYVDYHDREWGVPVHDDRKMFEFLVLESSQAGLSWYTVLRKRENYRKAFAHFDPVVVAGYDETQLTSLLQDQGLIRNRAKLSAAIHNAGRFLEVAEAFGSFAAYLWRFVGGTPIVNAWRDQRDCPSTSAVSDALAKDLKARGFRFLGSTVLYSHLQATGLINDHLCDCFRHREVQLLAKRSA